MRPLFFTLLLILLPAAALASASGAKIPGVRLEPALGRHYRPGAWLLVRAAFALPAESSGAFTPELRVTPPGEKTPAFISRLPLRKFSGGRRYRLSFWILAGDAAPRLRLRLRPAGSGAALQSDIFTDILQPLEPGWRHLLSLSRQPPVMAKARFATVTTRGLPTAAALYESCDLVILGSLPGAAAGPLPSPPQAGALAEWVARGGIVLVLNTGLGELLERAIELGGWHQGRRFPFVLPRSAGRSLPPPLAQRTGRGLVVYLDRHASAGMRARVGGAIWKKLEREYLPAPLVDLRLKKSRARYDALENSWPLPPRLSRGRLARWLGTWVIVSFALLVLPPVRRRPWATAGAVALTAVVLAGVFLRQNPPEPVRSMRATVRVAGEAGAYGPSFDEDLWFATPSPPTGKKRRQAWSSTSRLSHRHDCWLITLRNCGTRW